MESDPLRRYRRGGEDAAAAEKPEATPGSGLIPYQAFDTKDRVERLQVRRVLGATHAPSYGYLLDISYDRDFGTNLVLVYSFGLIVQVRGARL